MSKTDQMKAVDIFSLGVTIFDTISSGRNRLFQGCEFNEILLNNECFTGLNELHHNFIRSYIGEAYLYLLDSMLKIEQFDRKLFKVIETG